MTQVQNFIGGQFVPSVSGETLPNVGPATGQEIGSLPRSWMPDVDAAVRAATEAGKKWRRTSVEERAALLDRIADTLAQRAESLAALESQDQGKPTSLAAAVDIPRAEMNFRFFAGAIRHDHTDFHPMESAFNYTLRRPLGVVGLITPWNLPLYLLTWKVAPALAMGNAVVAKPSELTPLTADALAHIFQDIDAPSGLFNVVHGLGGEAGQAIVEHPDIQGISFTGGTETGAQVAATAAPMFKKLSLELGGKNATIVFADCDFDKAVEGAVRAGFANQGEICLCGSRLLVERPIYEKFLEAFVAKVSALKVGDPSAPDTQMGALVSAAHRDKVEGYVKLGIEEGGVLCCGGTRPELPDAFQGGYFLAPAVLAGLRPNCRTATEEVFGPLVTVHPFDSEHEALEIANGTRYGLAASIWTRDLSRAHRMAAEIDTGMVWVNTWLLRDLRVPFGGMKDSGVGREGGRNSLEFFSESRNICISL